MTLEEFVLTYKDDNGNTVINIADYYDNYIKPLDTRFKDSSFHASRTVICCFKDHQDINPSLGTVNHKYLKGVRVYHCFGCGASGTVIRLHQRIQREYYNRRITDSESALELCTLFGVDAGKFKDEVYDGDQSNFVTRLNKTFELEKVYTSKDFAKDILSVRRSVDSLSIEEQASKVNSAMIKYIATQKKLFD